MDYERVKIEPISKKKYAFLKKEGQKLSRRTIQRFHFFVK